jgi:hypothetical protein
MQSVTPTLLDPFEVAGMARPRLPSLPGSEQPTEWFDRGTLDMREMRLSHISHVALLEEINEAPPWTPEPIDRRWRARGWTDD